MSKVPEKGFFSAFKIIWDKISWFGLVHHRDLSSERNLKMFEKNYCKIKLNEYKFTFFAGSNALWEQFSLILVDPGEMVGNLMLCSG